MKQQIIQALDAGAFILYSSDTGIPALFLRGQQEKSEEIQPTRQEFFELRGEGKLKYVETVKRDHPMQTGPVHVYQFV